MASQYRQNQINSGYTSMNKYFCKGWVRKAFYDLHLCHKIKSTHHAVTFRLKSHKLGI